MSSIFRRGNAVIARAGALTIEPARMHLVYAGAAEDLLKPKLYVLAIGVADYVDPDLKLGWRARTLDFSATFKAQRAGSRARSRSNR